MWFISSRIMHAWYAMLCLLRSGISHESIIIYDANLCGTKEHTSMSVGGQISILKKMCCTSASDRALQLLHKNTTIGTKIIIL